MTCGCNDKGLRGWCIFCKISMVLVLIGAINWGFIGVGILMTRYLNVVDFALYRWPTVEAIVYVLVGLAGIALIVGRICGCCPCMKGCNGTCEGGKCEGKKCEGKKCAGMAMQEGKKCEGKKCSGMPMAK